MSKQVIIKIVISLVILLGVVAVIYTVIGTEESDNIKFKNEYESLNGQKNDKGKTYPDVSIDKDNIVKYASYEEVIELLDKGTGILYLGFPECPWCRNAAPILLETAKEEEVDTIYYFNALSIRDIKELDKDGKIVTTQKGTKEYYKLVDKLKDVLPAYEGLNDESIKRIYFPSVVFVMGGKIVGFHEGTVDSQENPYKLLDKKQKKELKEIYKDNIDKMYGICDEKC